VSRKASLLKRAEIEYVEKSLGQSTICAQCGTNLADFDRKCTASLSVMCPGFCRIEGARMEFVMRVAKGGGK
jgi:hypothetical protein